MKTSCGECSHFRTRGQNADLSRTLFTLELIFPISIIFGCLLKFLRGDGESVAGSSDSAFRDSLFWLPGIFLLMLAVLSIYYCVKVRPVLDAKRDTDESS